MIKKILFSVIVVVVLGLVTIFFVRNALVERAVETGCTYALGVETDLGSASLEIGGGSLELKNLNIANPEGFEGDNFLSFRRMMFDVEAGSVLDDEIVIDSFIIEGVELNLEQIDKMGNYRILLDKIKQLDMGESSDEEQKLSIGLVALRDIQVTGSLNLLGKSYEKSYTVENISIRDVGSDGGATIGELAATVVQALTTKALSAGSGVLPEGFGKDLSDLKDEGTEKIKQEASDKLNELGKSLTDGLK
ncbi:MAG: AsmA family protein [candidate division Zixibacteria bacterium]|nr:AsmA family protein [candidate division Zixibacteria bacterium]